MSTASRTHQGRLHPSGVEHTWALAEESPAAVLYNGAFFAVMMVTPADLEDFATGFTLTEGIVPSAQGILGIRVAETQDGHTLNIKIDPALAAGLDTRRRVLTGRSGCGICGAQTLDAAVARPRPVARFMPSPDAIARAYAEFPALQVMNRENRSTHAAAFADADGAISSCARTSGGTMRSTSSSVRSTAQK